MTNRGSSATLIHSIVRACDQTNAIRAENFTTSAKSESLVPQRKETFVIADVHPFDLKSR
jgi:hypothetical protein